MVRDVLRTGGRAVQTNGHHARLVDVDGGAQQISTGTLGLFKRMGWLVVASQTSRMTVYEWRKMKSSTP